MEFTDIALAKQRLLKKMTPALQVVAKRLDRSAYQLAKEQLKMIYRDGEDLRAVRDNPAKYGAKSIQQIADYRGVQPQSLYLTIRLTEIWTIEDIEELCQRYTETGKQICKNHLFVLCEVESHKRRDELLEEWFTGPMSVRELRGKVQREKKKRKQGVGRKPARPISILAGLQQMNKMLSSHAAFAKTRAIQTVDDVLNSPPSKLTEALASDYYDVCKSVDNLIASLKSLKEDMEKGASRMQTVLQESS